MREDREIDDPEGAVAPVGRRLPDEVVTDPGSHHHAPSTQPHPDGVLQRRQEVRQPGLPHPVAQVHRSAAAHQQDIGLPHELATAEPG